MIQLIIQQASIRVILPIVSVAMLATLYVLAQENTGKKYALLVGVQEYANGSGLRRLEYTQKDVTDLAEVLKQQGYIVTIMTESEYKPGKEFVLPDAKKIIKMLTRLVNDCKPEDTLLVALTGHGAHLKENNKLYFCPLGTELKDKDTMVSIDEVMAMFNEESCRAANKILLVDACRNDPSDGRSGGSPKELQSVTRPLIPKPPGGTVALFSCSQGEISHESLKQKRGYLFHHVIEGLSGKAANKRGEVTWSQLVTHVTEYLPQAVLNEKGPDVRQTPEAFGNSRGKIILARSDSTSPHQNTLAKDQFEPMTRNSDTSRREMDQPKQQISDISLRGECIQGNQQIQQSVRLKILGEAVTGDFSFVDSGSLKVFQITGTLRDGKLEAKTFNNGVHWSNWNGNFDADRKILSGTFTPISRQANPRPGTFSYYRQ